MNRSVTFNCPESLLKRIDSVVEKSQTLIPTIPTINVQITVTRTMFILAWIEEGLRKSEKELGND